MKKLSLRMARKNIPNLLHTLLPQGTFFSYMVNAGILGHDVANASIVTGTLPERQREMRLLNGVASSKKTGVFTTRTMEKNYASGVNSAPTFEALLTSGG